MKPHADAIRELGAEVHAIGCGSPQQLGWFIEDMEPGFAAWTDPAKRSFDAAGLKHGRWRTMGPASTPALVRALAAGYRQKGVKGDPYQQGGVFIVMPDGTVPWSYVNTNAGDHARPESILEALGAAVDKA